MYCDSPPERAQRTTTHASAQPGHRHRVLCTSSARPEAERHGPPLPDPALSAPASLRDDSESVERSPHAVLFTFAAELRDGLAVHDRLPAHAGVSVDGRARLSESLGIEVTADGFRLLAGPIAYAQFVDGEPLGDAALHQLITGWLALLP